MSAHEVMQGQAGDRLIIRWRPVGRSVTLTSHYASLEGFLADVASRDEECAWYEVNGGERVTP